MQKTLSQIKRLLDANWTAGKAALLRDIVVAVGFVALAIDIFIHAWVSEDAYITFRVIDNFMQGYGLRWNIHERVQVYTHPLWMLLHIPLYAVWDNLFYVNIALSIACSVAAIMLTLSTVQKSVAVTVVCFFAPLFASKAFIDYTTSGLENPLAYLLFAWFGYIVLHLQQSRRFWFWCSLSVALAMFNRLDTVLIYLPTLAWLAYSRRHDIRWGQVILGALPLLGWFAFSLFYYGFLFPNTKYAKLNTDLRYMRYIYHSLHYIRYFLVMDSMSALVLFATPMAWIAYQWRRIRRGDTDPRAWLCITSALGAYAYCLYVVAIGGDYMIGRFWALPIFVAVWTSYIFMPDNVRTDLLFAVACALLVAYLVPQLMDNIRTSCHTCVVGRERMVNASYTFRGNSLLTSRYPLRFRHEGQYHYADEGKRIAVLHDYRARTMYYIGMAGYYAGPRVPLIDILALADPLLARLPASKRQNFYAGHFRRDVPKGYQYAITHGSTERMNPSLAKYYEKLRLITSGNLFDAERLKTIIYFNLGFYDHWKQDYLKRR